MSQNSLEGITYGNPQEQMREQKKSNTHASTVLFSKELATQNSQ